MIKLNFGCGANRLPDWQNYDSEVDITRPLKWHDSSIDRVMAEHVVEHVGYYDALLFFKECHRILRPGGVARIAAPSVERIMAVGTEEYFKFASRWAPSPDRRGAMHAILYAHGHCAPWTEGLLAASLYYAGFSETKPCRPGKSSHEELCGVEGHGAVIGYEFNDIETVVVEATK
jgi:SAM-dependent methyltransferase